MAWSKNTSSNIDEHEDIKLLINEIGKATIYTNLSKTLRSIGDIKAGQEINGMSYADIITKILYPYTPPIIALISNLDSGVIRESGTEISSVDLIAMTIKNSNDITKIEYYKNDVLIYTNNSPSVSGGTEVYTDNSGFNNTTTYKAIAYDNLKNNISNDLIFKFNN
jgi:hypothetical protein